MPVDEPIDDGSRDEQTQDDGPADDQQPTKTTPVAAAVENARLFTQTRELSPYGGMQTRFHYQDEPKRVHILGSLEPQCWLCMLVAFTGNWGWAEGEALKQQMLYTEWKDLVPDEFERVFVFVVGTASFPTQSVCFPNYTFSKPDTPETWPYAHFVGNVELSNSDMNHVDFTPYATVPGDVFVEQGFAAFYPQIRAWSKE
ncbi:MAG: hypothetical protein ACYCXZ_03870 [Coriobacteriia bacterium]